jgi:hypothetical protein
MDGFWRARRTARSLWIALGARSPDPLFATHDFPGGGVLLGTVKGLFLGHAVNRTIIVDRAGSADTGRVIAMRDFPGGEGVLISAARGWFSAWSKERSQSISLARRRRADLG